jgi:prepilin-type processing-associated H-X9-DG protein/prepilin-type N-terminal cleavage/methylation domain-containing protein
MDGYRRAAFTLIELLVVITLIAFIAAILFPVFARVREKGRQTVCLSNMKQIDAAVMMYMQDYDESFPFVLNVAANFIGVGYIGDNGKSPVVPGVSGQESQFQLVNVVVAYVKDANVWYCPSVGPDYVDQLQVKASAWKKCATMRDQGTTYLYTYWSGPFPQIRQSIFMGGKPYAILWEPSRWPMLGELPNGFTFTGNNGDPPASAVPHSGGMNIAYGDGHAKFYRMETADGSSSMMPTSAVVTDRHSGSASASSGSAPRLCWRRRLPTAWQSGWPARSARRR